MDYKKLYQKMFKSVTEAIAILQQAQLECEDMYIEMGEKDDDKISQFTLVESKKTDD